MAVKKDPWFRNRLIRDGIYKAIYEAMRERSEIHILGEGAVMKVHFDAPDIEKEFSRRVITMPIAEDGSGNFAVGLSLAGVVPIVDVISSDFLYRTMDSICNTMAKAAVVGDARAMIVRAEFLTGGPTSGQRIESLFAHIPGIRVVVPSNPDDAYELMHEALRFKGVTVFFEDRMIEDSSMPKERFIDNILSPCGARCSRTRSNGTTVVSYGITCRRVEDALREKYASVIDLRYLWPLDVDTVVHHVNGGDGKLLVVEPDVLFLGIGAELVAQVVERVPGTIVKRLGAPRATIPASRELHDMMIPTEEQIIEAFEALQGIGA